MFVQQLLEVGIPYLQGRVMLLLETFQLKRKKMEIHTVSQAEKESKMPVYENTFDDYNEMVIQFGYLTLYVDVTVCCRETKGNSKHASNSLWFRNNTR